MMEIEIIFNNIVKKYKQDINNYMKIYKMLIKFLKIFEFKIKEKKL